MMENRDEIRIKNIIRVAGYEGIDNKIKDALSLEPEERKLTLEQIIQSFHDDFGIDITLVREAVDEIVLNANNESDEATPLSPPDQIREIKDILRKFDFANAGEMINWLKNYTHNYDNAYTMVILGCMLCGNRHHLCRGKFDKSEYDPHLNHDEGIGLIEKGVKLIESGTYRPFTLDHQDYRSIVTVYWELKRGSGGRHKLNDLERALGYAKKQLDEIPVNENRLIEITNDSISALNTDIKDEHAYIKKLADFIDRTMTFVNAADVETLTEAARVYKGNGAIKFILDYLPDEYEQFLAGVRLSLENASERDIGRFLSAMREAKTNLARKAKAEKPVMPTEMTREDVADTPLEPSGKICKCGFKNREKDKFCGGCGESLAAQASPEKTKTITFCGKCGTKNEDGEAFCFNCGNKLEY